MNYNNNIPKHLIPTNKLVLPPLSPNKPSRGYYPYEPSYSNRFVNIISLEEQEYFSKKQSLYPKNEKKSTF